MRVMVLVIVFLVLLSWAPAFSQPGLLGVYADTAGQDNCLIDAVGVLQFHVVHTLTAASTGSRFSAPLPFCASNVLWLADQSPHAITLGNSQTGVTVGYGACLGQPIHVLTILYLGQGQTNGCFCYPVLADPSSVTGSIEVFDCAGGMSTTLGVENIITNGQSNCCIPFGNCDTTCTVPTEESTWGNIKSLYGE